MRPTPRRPAKKKRRRSPETLVDLRAPRQEYLEALIEAVPDGVILFGASGELLAVNRGFATLYGVSRIDLQELDCDGYRTLLLSALSPAAGSRVREEITSSTSDRSATLSVVLDVVRPQRRFVSLYSAPALDREGEVFGRFALHRDVTKEYALLAQAQERADLPDINPIPLFKSDTLGRILFLNVAAERLLLGLGLTKDKASRMFPAGFIQTIREAVGERTGPRAFLHEYKKRSLAFTLSPHPRQPHCMVLVEDVTEQREAERAIRRYAAELESKNRELREAQAALVQSEKMASLGNLVAGVSHEINTPIGSLNSNADVMARALAKLREALAGVAAKIEDGNSITRPLDVLEEISTVNRSACERVIKIVQALRNFARLDEAARKRVDVHVGLESTLTLVHHEIKTRIEVVRDYGNVPEIECFPSQLNQVFMNVLVNASQAIEGEGRITIRTRSDGDRVRISFHDTGRGIDPGRLSRIFEPGLAPKSGGVGMGLGLAISYRIVQSHGGAIDVASEPGLGTTFTVTLPTKAAASTRPAPVPAAPRGRHDHP